MEAFDRIADGASMDFSLDLTDNVNIFAPELREWNVANQRFDEFGRQGDNEAVTDGPTNGSTWFSWRVGRFGSAVPEGLLTAVGWSRDLDVSLVNGSGRAALVAHAALPTSDTALLPAQVRALRITLPGDEGFANFDGPGDRNGSGTITQYIRPNGSDSTALAIQVRNEISEVQVWVDADGWRSFDLEEGNGLTLSIPEEAWNDDVLTVQYSSAGFFGDPAQSTTKLVEVSERTSTLPLLPPGERGQRDAQFDQFDGGFAGGDAELANEMLVELDDDGSFEAEGELFGTYDVWLVDLANGDSVTVRMNAAGNLINEGGLDPFLVIRDPDGNHIAENDDFNGLNSGLTFEAGAEGQYSIETRPLGGGQQGGGYQVTIEVDRAEEVTE